MKQTTADDKSSAKTIKKHPQQTGAQTPPAKRRGQLYMDLTVAATTIILVVGGVWYQISRNKPDVSCATTGEVHQLSVKADAFSQNRLVVSRCDTIQITNDGSENYDFAFGVHEKHIPYPGFTQQPLSPSEYFIVNAVQAGSYTLHDHLRDQAQLELDIREQ